MIEASKKHSKSLEIIGQSVKPLIQTITTLAKKTVYYCGNLIIHAFNLEKYILSPSSIRSGEKLTSTRDYMQQGRGLKLFLRNSRWISTYPNGFAGQNNIAMFGQSNAAKQFYISTEVIQYT